MLTSLLCPLCGRTHDADQTEGQFYTFACEAYGEIQLSRRSLVEFERHPDRLEGPKHLALQCKEQRQIFSASFHVPEGLRLECVASRA